MDNNQFGNGIPTDNNYQGIPPQQNINNIPVQNTQNINPQFVIGGQSGTNRNPNLPTQPTQNNTSYGPYLNQQYQQNIPVQAPSVVPIQQQNITNQVAQIQPEKPKKEKKNKKDKKRKKHGFLKFLLFFFLTVAVCIGSIFVIDKVTENQMDKFMPDYPYILNGEDTIYSIKNDFSLPKYIDYNGKQKEVSWKTNSDIVQIKENGDIYDATIVPAEKPSKVTLTATYKFLLIGKAERIFEIRVLPEVTISAGDVHVVDIETVKNKTYDENMTMVLRDDKTVASMYGDFKQKIYHSGDALAVLNAYKTELGFPEAAEFIEREVVTGEITTYLFDMAYDGVPIENSVVYMSVDEKYELNSIKCNFAKTVKQYQDVTSLPKEDTIDVLGEALNRNGDNTIAAIADKRYEEIDGQTCLVITYVLFYDNGEIHAYEVNATKGIVIGEVTESTYLFDGLTDKISDGVNSIKDAMITDATGKGVLGDTKKIEVSHIGPLHMLSHPNKKITAYTSLMDIPAYLQSLIANKMMEWGIWLGNNTKIPVIPDLMQVIGAIDGLVFSGVETLKSLVVCDIDDNFNVPLTEPAVDAYYHLNTAYDYYQKRFNRWSYDNKGAPIRVFTNFDHSVGSQFDNACWHGLYKCFYVYPVKEFGYSLAAHPEVLGHEYTHAVFGAYADGGGEISGLSEAYADIFGILMSHPNEWKVAYNEYNGVKCYIRDLEEINSAESIFKAAYKKSAPEKYHNSDWNAWGGEEHAIACMIGHIAYQMHSSGKFSQYELEEIWYKSLTYGYSGNDNYVTCRQQILQAMKELKFSAEQRDFVRGLFDEAEIFDDTDIYECEPEPTPEEIAYEELLEKLKELNSDGDSVHRFAIMTSPIGFGLNKVPLYIFEEKEKPSSEEEKLINDFLNQYWKNIGGEETSEEIGEYVGQREGNAIEYKQIPSWGMDIIETFLGKTRAEIFDIASDAITDESGSEEENSIVDTIVNLIFVGNVGESSRQEFFEGVIE